MNFKYIILFALACTSPALEARSKILRLARAVVPRAFAAAIGVGGCGAAFAQPVHAAGCEALRPVQSSVGKCRVCIPQSQSINDLPAEYAALIAELLGEGPCPRASQTHYAERRLQIEHECDVMICVIINSNIGLIDQRAPHIKAAYCSNYSEGRIVRKHQSIGLYGHPTGDVMSWLEWSEYATAIVQQLQSGWVESWDVCTGDYLFCKKQALVDELELIRAILTKFELAHVAQCSQSTTGELQLRVTKNGLARVSAVFGRGLKTA